MLIVEKYFFYKFSIHHKTVNKSLNVDFQFGTGFSGLRLKYLNHQEGPE